MLPILPIFLFLLPMVLPISPMVLPTSMVPMVDVSYVTYGFTFVTYGVTYDVTKDVRFCLLIDQIGIKVKILYFSNKFSAHFSSRSQKNRKLILKCPRFVPFGANMPK